jgi:predicted  nucleic acid-binding Zn-ribbon protein
LKIEATLVDIRALLELADADRNGGPRASETGRQRREAFARRLPRRLLDPYELLIEVGRTPAVVAIERGKCSGCHVRLPTMLEHRARRSLAIHRCPHCRRMIYAPELVSPAPPGRDEGSSEDAATSPGRRS